MALLILYARKLPSAQSYRVFVIILDAINRIALFIQYNFNNCMNLCQLLFMVNGIRNIVFGLDGKRVHLPQARLHKCLGESMIWLNIMCGKWDYQKIAAHSTRLSQVDLFF